MADQFLLEGNVVWSDDHEMAAVDHIQKIITGIVSGAGPLHHHSGFIALDEEELIIEGLDNDEDLSIPLACMTQIYLGFDEAFPELFTKGLGFFWQPLRITYRVSAMETKSVYLVIDFNGLYTHDKEWFNALTQVLQ